MIPKKGYWKIPAYALIFLIPTQLAFHFWPAFSLVFGIRVDYLAPAVYLTDILLLITVFLKRSDFIKWLNLYRKPVSIFVLLGVLNTVFSTFPVITLLKWLRIAEASAFGFLIYKERESLGRELILKILFISGVLFSLVGITQFILGQTTGFLYILGERSFRIGTPGIALVELWGKMFLRAYSTFPHPNALAGYLGLLMISLLGSGFLKKKKTYLAGYLLIFICFILTFSVSALIALPLALSCFFFKRGDSAKHISLFVFYLIFTLSLTLPLFSLKIFPYAVSFGTKFSERVDLAYISGKMISEKFLLGEGLNTFIPNIPKYKGVFSFQWILQPVHNIFLLTFAETGVIGIFTLFVLINKTLRNKNILLSVLIVFVILTGFFDHYWITLEQNLLALFLFTGLIL